MQSQQNGPDGKPMRPVLRHAAKVIGTLFVVFGLGMMIGFGLAGNFPRLWDGLTSICIGAAFLLSSREPKHQ